MISPIYAQYDDEDYEDDLDDSYLFNDEREESLTDKILKSTTSKAFSDTIGMKIGIYGQHMMYDMCGNPIIYGLNFFKIFHTTYDDNNIERYGGRWRREFRNIGWDIKNATFEAVGGNFFIGDTSHKVIGGLRIPLYFTRYTLKKINLVGIRYDVSMTDVFEFKSFATTRFKESSQTPHTENVAIEEKLDRNFYAFRPHINIGGISDVLPDFLKDQYLGVSFVHQALANGLHTDSGDFTAFLDNYSTGDIINDHETLLGIDLSGKITSFEYYFEYVHDSRRDHEKLSPTQVSTNDVNSSAMILKLNSRNILGGILGGNYEPYFLFSFEGWVIDSEYGGAWAVDDDDDNDGYLDEDLTHVDNFFPYERGDTYLNEPQAGVIYRRFNRNENRIPDYKEDFLLFYADRYFQKSSILEDANYNGILDYEENDLDPDFTYDRNRKGFRGYFGVNPYGYATLIAGGSYNCMASADNSTNNTAESYFLGFNVKRKLFKIFSLNTEFLYEQVFDRIADDYISLETHQLISDPLGYQDNTLYRVQFELFFIKYKDLIVEVHMRRMLNSRNFDKVENHMSRDIFKLGYDYSMDLEEGFFDFVNDFVFSPQLKFEKGQNRFFEEDSTEIYGSSDPFIMEQRHNFNMRALIFMVKYNFSDYIYIISGIQSKRVNDLYESANSSDRTTYAIQYVVTGMENVGTTFRKRGLAFTAGYKSINHEFDNGESKNEDTFFASLILTI